ncbi:MAG: hypothetical protein HYX96_08295 [Chloroflexi bacterium]|nr:hypothetical protein [Chloroflexota bacterium]
MQRKWLSIVLVVVLLLTGLVSLGAAPASPGKGPVDRINFIHYPKDAPGKPATAPGKETGGGVLDRDYKYSGVHWADGSALGYAVNQAGSGVDAGATISAVQASFMPWDNASGTLGFNYQGTTGLNAGNLDGTNAVSWADISGQFPTALAVTSVWYYRFNKQIVETDTTMNAAYQWSYTAPVFQYPLAFPDLSGPASRDASRYIDPVNLGPAGTYDIRNIMTHEAGHWIMLGDLYKSSDSELTMYGYGAPQELKKGTLAYGDELGVERVYP